MLTLFVGVALLIAPSTGTLARNAALLPPPTTNPTVSIVGDIRTIGTTITAPGSRPTDQPIDGPTQTQATSGAVVDPCFYVPIPALKGDPRLGGADPSTGVLYLVSCPDALNVATRNVIFQQQGAIWTPNGTPPAPPPPDPAQVAEEAAGKMTAPDPVIHLGPNAKQVAVKVPVWLWIDKPQPMTLTVAVRGLSVTVTATQISTSWSMGEGDRIGPSSAGGSPVTCAGTGTAPPPHPDRTVIPPCGYTYTWKSLPERTGGTGTYPVTATTNWQVTWTASDGTNGTLPAPLTPTATEQVAVGEWRTELVSGG